MAAFTSASNAFRPWRKLTLILARAAFTFVALAAIFLAVRWPFSESRVLKSIRDSWPGSVRVENFRTNFFPPGCSLENLVLELPASRSPEPARLTFHKAQIRARYIDLFFRPEHLALLAVDGLRVEVPVYSGAAGSPEEGRAASAAPGSGDKPGNSGQRVKTTFGEVEARDSTLEIQRSRGKAALVFRIHSLVLRPVRPDAPVHYEATLTNAEPPGEVHAHGQFGPWQSAKQVGDLSVSGDYTFDRANLGVFSGIAGILTSAGNFHGTLGQMNAQGDLNVPDFSVTRSRHRVVLDAKFRAVVDATRGNVSLNDVDASFRGTNVHADGTIAPEVGRPGKSVSVNLAAQNGRIEDVLGLFVTDKVPPMTGAADFQMHVGIPPVQKPFLKRLSMNGHFSIADAELTNLGRQHQLDAMSKRASGEAKNPETNRVHGRVEGKFVMRDGVARFDPLALEIPGASVAMVGKFNLLNEDIDFHGHAKTAAKLSEQSSGVKSVLLKPLNRLFKKRDAGAEVPVQMTGTYNSPHFGLDLTGKR